MKELVPLISLSEKNKQRLLEIATELISRESDSMLGQEGSVGTYIASFLEDLGLVVSRQYCSENRFNVITRISGKDERHCTMYCGHMDTVPLGDSSQWESPACTPAIRDEKIFGRGACDMKGSLACSLFMAEYLKDAAIVPKHDILLVYDIDEENTNLGLKKYLLNPDEVDFIIVGEPTELAIDIGHRGVIAFTVEVYGKSAHIGQAQLGRNALYTMVEIINEIMQLHEKLNGVWQEYLGSPSIFVTQFDAGEKVNIVPDRATIRVDRRLVDGETLDSCRTQLQEIVATVCNKHTCDYSITMTTYCPPCKTDASGKQIQSIMAMLEHYGMNAKPKAFEASCEAGLLKERLGVPVAILGPGSISQAHKPNEYIEMDQLFRGAELYISLFSQFSY